MYKELIIATVILVSIFFIDFFLQKYTDEAISEISDSINTLTDYLKKQKINDEKAIKDINEIYNKWLEKQNKLAYFIEHNELEKVENDFVAGKSYIELKNYEDALCELDKTVFVLNHINEKYSFNLKNIF